MLCGGYDIDDYDYGVMTGGCYIWSDQGWIQSDTTFNRRLAAASETSAGLLVTGGMPAYDYYRLSSTLLFTTSWQDFTGLPLPTYLHCQVTVSDTVYVVGGLIGNTNGFKGSVQAVYKQVFPNSGTPCHADERGLVAVLRGIHFNLHVLLILYGVKTCFATKLNFQLYHLVTMI